MDRTAADKNPPTYGLEQGLAGASLMSSPDAVAGYIATMAQDLSFLARRSGLTTLAYILEMANLEARNVLSDCGAAKREPPQAPVTIKITR